MRSCFYRLVRAPSIVAGHVALSAYEMILIILTKSYSDSDYLLRELEFIKYIYHIFSNWVNAREVTKMKTGSWEKLPAAAFLFNFGSLTIFTTISAYWMSVDNSLVFAIAGLLPVIVIGAAFFFVSRYALRFTGSYFHRMVSKGCTAMKCYTLFEIGIQELILVVSLYVYICIV